MLSVIQKKKKKLHELHMLFLQMCKNHTGINVAILTCKFFFCVIICPGATEINGKLTLMSLDLTVNLF